MRASPCGLIAASLEETLELAKVSTEVTHDHPEGIKGTQVTTATVYLAKSRHTLDKIRSYIHENFYPMDRTQDEIRPRTSSRLPVGSPFWNPTAMRMPSARSSPWAAMQIQWVPS